MAVFAGACSPSLDSTVEVGLPEQAADAPQPTLDAGVTDLDGGADSPVEEPGPTDSTPEPAADEPVEQVVAPTGRATRIQVAVLADETLFEVDGGNAPVLVGDFGFAVDVNWIGPERRMVIMGEDTISLWHPESGVIAAAPCAGCLSAVDVNGDLVVMDKHHVLWVFDSVTMIPLWSTPTALPEPGFGLETSWPRAVAEMDGMAVVIASIADPSAYGGPESIWLVDPSDGAATKLADTDSNISSHRTSVSADGTRLAIGGVGWRNGFCDQDTTIAVLDLTTGALEMMPQFYPAEDFLFANDSMLVTVYDTFWNGPTLYAIAEMIWTSPLSGICETSYQPALYRLDGDGWHVVDGGPVEGVRPTGPDAGAKVVEVFGTDVYIETADSSEKFTDLGRIINSTTAPTETSLFPPSPPPAVRATHEQILAAATAGDIEALATLAEQNPSFGFTFGPPDSVLDFWNLDSPTDAMLLVFNGPPKRDGTAFVWSDHPGAICRGSIEADGTWNYFICGD